MIPCQGGAAIRLMHAGQHVTPTIRLVRLLGEGAMGSVWAAEHLALDTLVAVKFMTRDHVLQPDLAARFRREAQAAAQLRSPHVTQGPDYGVTPDGEPYIVMELLEGETLGNGCGGSGICRLARWCTLLSRWPRGSAEPTSLGSFTAISSRTTCS